MRHPMLYLLGVVTSCVTMAAAAPDKRTDEVLAAMARTSTYGHPDQFGEFAGMRLYQAGHYGRALEYFRYGARYADKLSQLSIGLMTLNGEGVTKDPATAWAWFALAAERGYPTFVATRERVWAQLDAAQRERAKDVLATLSPEFGDAAAKPRMARELRRGQATMTGSFLGFGRDSVASMTPAQMAASMPALRGWAGASPPCASPSIEGAPIAGCGNLFVAWRWQPDLYFKTRDAIWSGTVTVEPLQQVRDPQHPPD